MLSVKRKSDNKLSRKVSVLRKEGYPPKQAVAIAYSMKKRKKFKEGGTTKDACYHKVVSRYGPKTSAYRSGAMAKCRKVGAANWGNKSKK